MPVSVSARPGMNAVPFGILRSDSEKRPLPTPKNSARRKTSSDQRFLVCLSVILINNSIYCDKFIHILP